MANYNPQQWPNQAPPYPGPPHQQAPRTDRTPLVVILVCVVVLALSVTGGALYLLAQTGPTDEANSGPSVTGPPVAPESKLDEQLLLEGHTGRIAWMEFTPDAEMLVSADTSGQVFVWEVATGERRHTITAGDTNFAFAMSSDGTTVASLSGPSEVKLWNLETGQETLSLPGHISEITSLGFHPDGTSLAVGQESGQVTLWDIPAGTQKAQETIYPGEPASSVTFSEDGSTILSRSFDGHAAAISDGETGTLIHRLEAHTNYVYEVSFSPNQETVLTSSLDETAIVWDVETGNQLQRFQADAEGAVFESKFSPDGSMVATGGNDDSPKLWNVATGERVHDLGGHTGDIFGLAFNSDGTRLVTTSSDGSAIVWDTATGEMIQTLSGHKGELVSTATTTGRTILATSTSGPAIYVWDFSGPTIPDFSPAGQPTGTEPPQPIPTN